MKLTGRCRCGQVKYSVDQEWLPVVYACHCHACQVWSGSAFGLHALLPASLIQIMGDLTEFAQADESGRLSRHWFCPACATRIANDNEAVPGMMVLRAGTLDRSAEIIPAVHIWTSRKQPWVQVDRGAITFDFSPTPEEFGTALAQLSAPS